MFYKLAKFYQLEIKKNNLFMHPLYKSIVDLCSQ